MSPPPRRGLVTTNRRTPRRDLPRGSSKTAREMNWGILFERSILGHDGDRCLAPVAEAIVQPEAESVIVIAESIRGDGYIHQRNAGPIYGSRIEWADAA